MSQFIELFTKSPWSFFIIFGIIFTAIGITDYVLWLNGFQKLNLGRLPRVSLAVFGLILMVIGLVPTIQAMRSIAASPTPTINVTPSSSPTPTLIYTQTALSDGRTQAWQSIPHDHSIQSRWIDNGQWTPWSLIDYPPSNAGVIELSASTQQGITSLTVRLDDGSCWQQQKLSTSPYAHWSAFTSC